jgi:hypothetical protein
LPSTAAESLHQRRTGPRVEPRPFALIACQRAGAHLFADIVNSHPCVAFFAEPFTRLPKWTHWCNYVRTLPPDRFPALFAKDAMDLLDQYVQAIRCDVDQDVEAYGGYKLPLRAIGLDVKYNQLRAVTSLLADLGSPPVLLDYFCSRGFRIIHLVRKNIVHNALSLLVAKYRNIWTNENGGVIDGRYRISWAMLQAELRWIAEARDNLLRWADELQIPLHTCTYEDLVADLGRIDREGNFPENTAAVRPLAELLGVPNWFHFLGRQHKVINRPYSEIIDGYDDVVQELQSSEFAEFAETI